jgi:hypothetical protein
MMSPWSLLFLLNACGEPPVADRGAAEQLLPFDEAPEPTLLSPTDRLLRTSMALRGLRPSVEELGWIQQDPALLEELVDDYLDSPEFGLTVRDMHAEALLLRGVEPVLPSIDLLDGYTQGEIARALSEAPLRLVEEVVMSDSPYTEILTADYAMANGLMELALEVERRDPELGPEDWGRADWLDGRPSAGLLASSGLWLQHPSAGGNHHRGRANLLSRALICTDFLDRDVNITGSVDLSDPEQVAEAVIEDPACSTCHQALDPLAGFLWGFRGPDMFHVVNLAYQRDDDDALILDEATGEPICLASLTSSTMEGGPLADGNCLPLVHYDVSNELGWQEYGLRDPGYFGLQSGEDLRLDDLGIAITEDPRFSLCTVRRVASYLGQRPTHDLPDAFVASLQADFIETGFDFKALAKQIVLSDAFLSLAPATDEEFVFGLQILRPEQAARVMAQLTGLEWSADPDPEDCGDKCWGPVDVVTSARFGLRTLLGGTDASSKSLPTLTPTPVQLLGLRRLAAEAAAEVVAHDFGTAEAGDRRLLDTIDLAEPTEESVRTGLVALHLRILGEVIDPEAKVIDQELALFLLALSEDGDPADAWELVLTLLLQDIRMVFY